jgi:hypothetical protein
LWARPFEVVKLHETSSGAQMIVETVASCGGYTSDSFPFAGIVSLGGSMGAYEDADHVWMPIEKQILRDAVAAGNAVRVPTESFPIMSVLVSEQACRSWVSVWARKC